MTQTPLWSLLVHIDSHSRQRWSPTFIFSLPMITMLKTWVSIVALALRLTSAAEVVALGERATPTIPQTAGSFVYSLCAVEPFYNGIQARALHGASQVGVNMTVEMCASYCSGFNYFGVEYADGNMFRCPYCSMNISNISPQSATAEINYTTRRPWTLPVAAMPRVLVILRSPAAAPDE